VPRLSSEARSAAAWRAGNALPPAPKYMGKDARAIWAEITASRPVDYFDAATRPMLETFCCASSSLRALSTKMVGLDPRDPEFGRLVRLSAVLTTVQSTMAVRLRLCQSARMRYEDGRLDEKRSQKSWLLGGTAVNN
jgi:hypothetical protein